MKTARLRFELLGWWHAGSGYSRGGDADALVIRDPAGLPYLPGRTVKGLLRDACRLVHTHQHTGLPDRWFGPPEPPPGQTEPPGRPSGELRFGDARLPETERAWFAGETHEAARRALFPTLAATALTEAGVAQPNSLRTIEVAPPLTLEAEITGPDDPAWVDELATAARLIRHLGSHRHRGLGRCRVTLVCDPAPPAAATPPAAADAPASATSPPAAGCQWLEIELLSDVIFSAHGATLGIHQTLDYVPGSALLGAAAGPLFRGAKDKAAVADALLGGALRFSDGLPLAADDALGWPVPGTFRVLKVSADPAGSLALINALTDTRAAAMQRGQPDQPLRGGGVTAGGRRLHPETHFALKSKRDGEQFGRAADAQLFGYAMLRAGQRFLACLRWDAAHAAMAATVLNELTRAPIALGRSRSAEFGAAHVSRVDPPPLPDELPTGPAVPDTTDPHLVLYLASDLALERDGLPLLDPAQAVTDLGLPTGSTYVLERSAVRTRRYAPWNAFHHGRDRERQVLTRGSVLTFRLPAGTDHAEAATKARQHLAAGLGEFRQDGLGWVLVNPDFVVQPPANLQPPDKPTPPADAPASERRASASPPTPLARFAQRDAAAATAANVALELGKKWFAAWEPLHAQAARASRLRRAGPSQWNQVRQLAVTARGDLAVLKASLEQFFTTSLRHTYWAAEVKPQRLDQALLAVCQPNPAEDADDAPGPLCCAALAHAARLMVRHFQQRDHDDSHS